MNEYNDTNCGPGMYCDTPEEKEIQRLADKLAQVTKERDKALNALVAASLLRTNEEVRLRALLRRCGEVLESPDWHCHPNGADTEQCKACGAAVEVWGNSPFGKRKTEMIHAGDCVLLELHKTLQDASDSEEKGTPA